MKKILALFAVLFIVSGCASVARSDYAGDKKYADIQSAMQHTAPLAQLVPGAVHSVKISTDSPLLDSPSGKGRFERIAIKGRKGESFSFALVGVCDCLGFRKWMVAPYAYLLDASGAVVAPKMPGQPPIGKFPADGDYALMVVADSVSNGTNIGYLVGGLLTLPLISHPTGIVNVTWIANTVPAPDAASGQ